MRVPAALLWYPVQSVYKLMEVVMGIVLRLEMLMFPWANGYKRIDFVRFLG